MQFLSGSMDPYNRGPRSPRNKRFPTDGSGTEDGARSPTNDQVGVQLRVTWTLCLRKKFLRANST